MPNEDYVEVEGKGRLMIEGKALERGLQGGAFDDGTLGSGDRACNNPSGEVDT